MIDNFLKEPQIKYNSSNTDGCCETLSLDKNHTIKSSGKLIWIIKNKH